MTPMVTKQAGIQNAERILALLWRSRTTGELRHTHGPKPRLNIDQLVHMSIAIANTEGLEGVTMRRVAHAIGVSTMSLYTYLASKAELVDLMIDMVYVDMDHQPLGADDWRERITAIAHTNYALYQRHPWMVEVASERPPLGPGVITKYERELRALEGLGLSDLEMDSALTFLLNFVRAAACDAIQAERLRTTTAMTNAEWWAAHAEVFAAHVAPGEFPIAERVGTAAGAVNAGATNATFAYAFGLQRVLDGLGHLIASGAGSTPEPML